METPISSNSRACNVAKPSEAREFEEFAVTELRSTGLRITSPRTQVIRVFAHSNRAMTINEIHRTIVAERGRIDLVSVYRIVSTLVEIGLVHHIGVVDGYIACRSPHESAVPHNHLVCEECGCVSESSVEPAILDRFKEVSSENSFAFHTMRVELLGLCAHCQPT